MTLGQKIKLKREELGINQVELSKLSGVSIQSIKLYETNKTSGSMSILKKIAAALKSNVSFFLSDENLSISHYKNSPNLSIGQENQLKNDNKLEQQAGLTDNLSISQEADKVLNITVLSHHAAAGTTADMYGVEVFDTHKILTISQMLFKTMQNAENLRTTRVDGYSMIPILLPDNWVIFDITKKTFIGDGLYVLMWRDMLMVKLLQLSSKGTLKIVSKNPDYETWEIDPDDQSVFKIFGKVVKIIC